MSTCTTLGDFLTNLRGVLERRAALAQVTIFTAEIDEREAGGEAIVFGVKPTDVRYEYPTAPGRETFENYEVEGRVWVVKPGGGEAVIAATRERAIELFSDVHEALDDDQTTAECQAAFGVDDCRVVSYQLTQVAGDGYRDARLTFSIAVRARFTP